MYFERVALQNADNTPSDKNLHSETLEVIQHIFYSYA